MRHRRNDPLYDEYVAKCEHCGWEKKFEQAMSCGLKIGDVVFRLAEDPNFNRCNRCKRRRLIVTSVPAPHAVSRPVGFWNIPTE
jgi:hypothetical protein